MLLVWCSSLRSGEISTMGRGRAGVSGRDQKKQEEPVARLIRVHFREVTQPVRLPFLLGSELCVRCPG